MPADETKPIADLDDVVSLARAKLRELAICDLRFHWPRFARISAGGAMEVGSDHSATRQALRQLLSDIDTDKTGVE